MKELKATFENGDILILKLGISTFAGYKPEMIWELSYGEQCGYPSGTEYNMLETEYFPASMTDTAQSAFNKRCNSSNPKHESDMSWDLTHLLKSDKNDS